MTPPLDRAALPDPAFRSFLDTITFWFKDATDDEVLALDDLVLKERTRRGLDFEKEEIKGLFSP